MSRVYYVSGANSTPDERGPGWFYCDEESDRIRGPFFTRDAAFESMGIDPPEWAKWEHEE
jgi:hypothetical protein